MASLRHILNPVGSCSADQSSSKDIRQSCSPSPSSMTLSPLPSFEDSGRPTPSYNHLPHTFVDSTHPSHDNCPDSLSCLSDTNGKPQHTLPIILRCAILGSVKKRLTIRNIYAAMEKKYPYFKTAGPTWKQSVRHHLSLNRLFEKQARPVTDPGFGSYWTVNLEAPPGTKRPRKRGRANKNAEKPLPKSRGRVKRVREEPYKPASARPSMATNPVPEFRQSPLFNPSAFLRTPKLFPAFQDDDDIFTEAPTCTPSTSEEAYRNCGSEEDPLAYHADCSPASSSLQYPASPIAGADWITHASTSASGSEPGGALIDRLYDELQELRKQNSLASLTCAKMSQELNAAKFEMDRLRQKNELLERRLDQELSGRIRH